ncbi:AMP-binding protein [Prauserella oleivorans]
MYPGVHAVDKPAHQAMVMAGSGRSISYADLDRRSVQLARVFDSYGLSPTATVAVACENRLEWAEMIWAAARSGRCLAPVNWHLGARELSEVLRASGAELLLAGPASQTALRGCPRHHRRWRSMATELCLTTRPRSRPCRPIHFPASGWVAA